MHTCPECHGELNESRDRNGTRFTCSTCGGEAVTAFRLKKLVGGALTDSMQRLAAAHKKRSNLLCPTCSDKMFIIPMAAGDDEFDIDYCRTCASFWLSSGKLERLPTDRAGEIPKSLDPDQFARETGALAEVEEIRRRSQESEPTEMWKHIIGLMGLPVEENHPSHKQPLATWSIAALCSIIFLITLAYRGSLIYQLGFIPNEPFRYGGINLLTSFVTHGCWAHLLGNMYFLCVFGDNVEERLGVRNYLLMLLAGSIVGTLTHSLFDPRSSVPLIGASDSISAIIVYYALQFPRERLCFLLWYWWHIHWVSISAIWCLALWIVWLFVLTGLQATGLGDVSALAHLGGAAVGAAFWWYFEKRHRTEPTTQFNRIQTVFK